MVERLAEDRVIWPSGDRIIEDDDVMNLQMARSDDPMDRSAEDRVIWPSGDRIIEDDDVMNLQMA